MQTRENIGRFYFSAYVVHCVHCVANNGIELTTQRGICNVTSKLNSEISILHNEGRRSRELLNSQVFLIPTKHDSQLATSPNLLPEVVYIFAFLLYLSNLQFTRRDYNHTKKFRAMGQLL